MQCVHTVALMEGSRGLLEHNPCAFSNRRRRYGTFSQARIAFRQLFDMHLREVNKDRRNVLISMTSKPNCSLYRSRLDRNLKRQDLDRCHQDNRAPETTLNNNDQAKA